MRKIVTGRRQVLTALAAIPLVSAPFIRRASAAEFSFKIAHPLAATHPRMDRLARLAEVRS